MKLLKLIVIFALGFVLFNSIPVYADNTSVLNTDNTAQVQKEVPVANTDSNYYKLKVIDIKPDVVDYKGTDYKYVLIMVITVSLLLASLLIWKRKNIASLFKHFTKSENFKNKSISLLILIIFIFTLLIQPFANANLYASDYPQYGYNEDRTRKTEGTVFSNYTELDPNTTDIPFTRGQPVIVNKGNPNTFDVYLVAGDYLYKVSYVNGKRQEKVDYVWLNQFKYNMQNNESLPLYTAPAAPIYPTYMNGYLYFGTNNGYMYVVNTNASSLYNGAIRYSAYFKDLTSETTAQAASRSVSAPYNMTVAGKEYMVMGTYLHDIIDGTEIERGGIALYDFNPPRDENGNIIESKRVTVLDLSRVGHVTSSGVELGGAYYVLTDPSHDSGYILKWPSMKDNGSFNNEYIYKIEINNEIDGGGVDAISKVNIDGRDLLVFTDKRGGMYVYDPLKGTNGTMYKNIKPGIRSDSGYRTTYSGPSIVTINGATYVAISNIYKQGTNKGRVNIFRIYSNAAPELVWTSDGDDDMDMSAQNNISPHFVQGGGDTYLLFGDYGGNFHVGKVSTSGGFKLDRVQNFFKDDKFMMDKGVSSEIAYSDNMLVFATGKPISNSSDSNAYIENSNSTLHVYVPEANFKLHDGTLKNKTSGAMVELNGTVVKGETYDASALMDSAFQETKAPYSFYMISMRKIIDKTTGKYDDVGVVKGIYNGTQYDAYTIYNDDVANKDGTSDRYEINANEMNKAFPPRPVTFTVPNEDFDQLVIQYGTNLVKSTPPDKYIKESDEDDNYIYYKYNVASKTDLDLVVSNFRTSDGKTSYMYGTKPITVMADITNAGKNTVNDVPVRLSRDGVSTDTIIKQIKVGEKFTASFAVNDTLSLGGHSFTIMANPPDANNKRKFEESNYNNNSVSGNISITNGPVVSGVDLEATEFQPVSPLNRKESAEVFDVSAMIKNNSNKILTNVKVELKVDGGIYKSTILPNFAANGQTRVPFQVSGLPVGNRSMTVSVNPDRTISESTYSNNYASGTVEIFSYPPPPPPPPPPPTPTKVGKVTMNITLNAIDYKTGATVKTTSIKTKSGYGFGLEGSTSTDYDLVGPDEEGVYSISNFTVYNDSSVRINTSRLVLIDGSGTRPISGPVNTEVTVSGNKINYMLPNNSYSKSPISTRQIYTWVRMANDNVAINATGSIHASWTENTRTKEWFQHYYDSPVFNDDGTPALDENGNQKTVRDWYWDWKWKYTTEDFDTSFSPTSNNVNININGSMFDDDATQSSN